MKPEICALNLVTLDFIYSGIHRLPGLGEEVSTNHLTLSLGGGPIASLITAARLGATVRLATCLGRDRFSCIARDFLKQEAIPYRSFETSMKAGQSRHVNPGGRSLLCILFSQYSFLQGHLPRATTLS